MKADDLTRPYPCVIVATRYSGVYEGGRWAAFQATLRDLAREDWNAGDTFVAGWWRENKSGIGVGDSPQEAYEALCSISPERRWRGKKSK